MRLRLTPPTDMHQLKHDRRRLQLRTIQLVLCGALVLLTHALFVTSFAADLGRHGRVYQIVEIDLLQKLYATAQDELDSGRWDARIDQWRTHAKARAARPPGVILPRATKPHAYFFDPGAVAPRDVLDGSGNVIIPAGTRVNPLDSVSLNRNLIFIDGDDTRQVDWLVSAIGDRQEHYKVILVNGPILDLMRRHNMRFYFDQHQTLVNKLSIQRVPSVVSQDGKLLKIQEIPLL